MDRSSLLKSKRILIVDDDPRNLLALEARLEVLGHEVIKARGGAEAIERYDANPPDLILVDLVMPGTDGLAVVGHVRRGALDRHIPIVIVTAHSEREHRLRGLQAGADEVLEKPIDGPILLARVQTLLRLKESHDELQASRDSLAKRNALLERLQREQRELMQFIVHDLKTPLSVIAANLEWARDNATTATQDELRDALQDSNSGARQLRAMIEDLLAVSRLEDSSFPLARELFSVGEMFRSIAQSYGRKARQRAVSLAPISENDCKVWADRALLRRVIENILDNSLRYTPECGRVGLAMRSADAVEIAISNNGPAIAPEDRERIFEKFARGSAENPVAGSAGLGLYFCKRAVEAHGGRIHVLETPDWPTSFVIQLPNPPADSVRRASQPHPM
jgi:two-component system, sensor histidine kinase and response regulator